MDIPHQTVRDQIVDTLEHIYGPVLIGLGFALLYLTQDPAQEVVLGLLHELGPISQWGAALTEGSLSLADITRQIMSLTLLWAIPIAVWSASSLAVRNTRKGLTRWGQLLPIIAALTVFAALAWGTSLVATSAEATNLRDGHLWRFYLGIVPGVIYGIVLHRLLGLLAAFVFYAQRRPQLSESIGTLAMLAVFMLPILWIGFLRPDHAFVLGPVGVAATFVLAASYFLAALTMLSGRAPYEFPLILVLILMSAAVTGLAAALLLTALAVLGLGLVALRFWLSRSKHRIPGWVAPWHGKGTLTGLKLMGIFGAIAAYLLWTPPDCGTLSGCNIVAGQKPDTLVQKRTLDSFADWNDRNAPTIRLVAAQGGGLYAAYHTAYYLAARADEDPAFARSIFAISGVSGGSVGAGVFWAVLKSKICAGDGATPTCHRDAVRAILHQDFLSPTLSAFFFRDALDSVVPISYLFERPIDRGRVLENLFADRIAAVTGQDGLLDTALIDSWGPDQGVPLLMLNATEVGSGARRILSPLPLLPDDVPARIALEDGRDLTVGNAMTISARFPFVTPPARIRRRDETGKVVVRQLVDGGYFDNSGIETVMEALQDIVTDRGYQPVEVLVFSVDERMGPVSIKGTIGAPVGAFTGAWRARRDLSAARLSSFATGIKAPDPAQVPILAPETTGKVEAPVQVSAPPQPDAKSPLTVCPIVMYQQTMNFTVSWYLTADTFREIEIQMDDLAENGTPCQAG